ncbi:MAG: DNA polymerase IV [Spirochaetes bacterium]|nr:MAG: DNA polymerase IV [Spirochaetota bacterium]
MAGTILHVNAVGLMAALAELKDPSLRRRPFVVAREGLCRAVVSDLSPEAHREGIRRGMLLSLAQRRLPGLRVVEPDSRRCGQADDLMWEIALSFTPLVERGGQGHLFLDLAGTGRINGPPQDASMRLRREILAREGISPTIALASTKTSTKVATRVFRPGGFVALNPNEETQLVRLQPVELLPGVGPVLKDRLSLLDIEDIGTLADLRPFEARAIGPRGPELVARAGGLDDSPVNPQPPERRSLEASAVLEPDSLTVLRLSAALGFQARTQGLGARRVGVGLDFTDGREAFAALKLPRASSRDDELCAAAWEAARRAASRRVRVRRIMVRFSEFGAAGPELDLFEPRDAKLERLQGALDRIHGRHGLGALAPCSLLALAQTGAGA